MRRFARRITLLITVAAMLISGCGGSGSKTSAVASTSQPVTTASSRPAAAPSGAALTSAQYIRRADAICRRQQRATPRFPGLRSGNGLVTTASRAIPYLQTVQSLLATTVTSLRGLVPPAKLRTATQNLVSAGQARLQDLTSALAAAQRGDGGGFTAAFQKDQAQDGPAYSRAATAVGLHVCALGR